MPFFICISSYAWGAGDTVAAAQTNCRRAGSTADTAKEHFVYECPGERNEYSVSCIDGSLEWRKEAGPPVRVLHHRKGRKADARRLTMAQLREERLAEVRAPA
jgi:hypothetical protein